MFVIDRGYVDANDQFGRDIISDEPFNYRSDKSVFIFTLGYS